MTRYQDLKPADRIEVTYGTGTQRGVVTHITKSGVVYATMYRASTRQWSPVPVRIRRDRFIDVIKEVV